MKSIYNIPDYQSFKINIKNVQPQFIEEEKKNGFYSCQNRQSIEVRLTRALHTLKCVDMNRPKDTIHIKLNIMPWFV